MIIGSVIAALVVKSSVLPVWFLVIAQICAALVGVAVLVGALIWVLRWSRHMKLVHEAIIGRPAAQGLPGVPSMIDRFDAATKQIVAINDHLKAQDEHLKEQDTRLAAQAKRIEHEFGKNGGSSLRDRIDVAADGVEHLKEALRDVQDAAIKDTQRLDDHLASHHPNPSSTRRRNSKTVATTEDSVSST